MGSESVREAQFIGRGRSASVYKLHGPEGLTARKIFTGSKAAKLVMILFYGAPTDYIWCESAIQAAFYRRRVLSRLVPFWFGESLQIADAYAWGWDEDRKAWYLDTEFVGGHPARLYSPFLYGQRTEIYDLQGRILPQLQERLIESGFVGTVWQAGKGQPCAIPNFLCIRHDQEGDHHRWAWIDAESGVPAIVSYNPRALFGFYIPEAIKHRRVLFDDLDEPRLRVYIEEHRDELEAHLGAEGFIAFMKDIEELTDAHHRWSQENRISRSVGHYLAKGRITVAEYQYYITRGFQWYMRLLKSLLKIMPGKVWRWLKGKVPKFLKLINPLRWVVFFFNLMFSRNYRVEVSRAFARYGIREWRDARRITEEQAEILEAELQARESNQYLADFGVHLSMKPLGWILRVTLIPALLGFGLISLHVSGILIVFMGTILRTLYAVIRAVEDVIMRRGAPFLALMISPIPSLGALAYPCQMLRSARKGHMVSQFIIYESCSAIAERIPIWGGRDTAWDHAFNRLAHAIIAMSD